MEEEIFRKIARTLICAVFIALFCAPVFAVTAENKTVEKKPSVLTSIVNKLTKNKTKINKKSAESATAPNKDTLLTGNIVFSMEDCEKLMLKNDPNIKIKQDIQKAQKSAVGIAKSNYFPTIYGSTGYNLNNTQYSRSKDDAVANNYYGLNLGINQLIWDFGKTTAQINMNKYNYEAAGYDLANQITLSTYAVRINYTTVLAARANVDIYNRSVRINELNVERTKAMYDVGLKSKIDVVNAQVYLTEAKIDLLQAQNEYQTALINLNNSMYYVDAPEYLIKDTETFNFQKNYSVKNEIDVSYDRKNYNPDNIDIKIKDGAILTSEIEKTNILKTYKFKPYDLSLQDCIKTAYDNRPDFKSIILVEKASKESLKAIERSFYPVINASGGYTYGARSDYSSNAIGAFAGVSLPNVNAMATKYAIEQGKSYLDVASTNVDLLKKNIYFDVQGYYVDMKQLEKRIPLMSQRVEQTLENFELADGRYAVGLSNYLELQQAQTNYNNAQLAFVQSVFDYNEALFYLKRAMGIL